MLSHSKRLHLDTAVIIFESHIHVIFGGFQCIVGAWVGFCNSKILSGFNLWTVIYDTIFKVSLHLRCLTHIFMENTGCTCLVSITDILVPICVVEVIVVSGNATVC
jgi:hypothetical protein